MKTLKWEKRKKDMREHMDDLNKNVYENAKILLCIPIAKEKDYHYFTCMRGIVEEKEKVIKFMVWLQHIFISSSFTLHLYKKKTASSSSFSVFLIDIISAHCAMYFKCVCKHIHKCIAYFQNENWRRQKNERKKCMLTKMLEIYK